MPLAIVYTRASFGLNAPLVTVEVHLSLGMAKLDIVGLPEKAVNESRHRVRSALMNTHFEFPSHRMTINLAPADIPKEGGRFDLPIAIGILVASQQIPFNVIEGYEFTGELALSGELLAVRGVLPMVLAAHQAERQLIIPKGNAEEAALVQKATVYKAAHILDVCAHLRGEQNLTRCVRNQPLALTHNTLDMADVKGQPHAKRALEIAAAGRHSLLFVGPPGTGKTMLASRLPSILPAICEEKSLEVAAVASISTNGFDAQQWQKIPFRSPHHSSSTAALVGGGRPPRPGEISLAHHGVLFLDELPEFSRQVLESLREPLESGCVTISRAAYQTVFPAQFQLVAAMNPCPCGYASESMEHCRCNAEQIKRYLAKLSGPLLDRIDLQVEVSRLEPDSFLDPQNNDSETSAVIHERVVSAHLRQLKRQNKENALLTVPELNHYAEIEKSAKLLLKLALVKFNLSARAYHRIVKIARTIADLSDEQVITENTVSEALSYRYFDRTKQSYV